MELRSWLGLWSILLVLHGLLVGAFVVVTTLQHPSFYNTHDYAGLQRESAWLVDNCNGVKLSSQCDAKAVELFKAEVSDYYAFRFQATALWPAAGFLLLDVLGWLLFAGWLEKKRL